MRRQFCLTGIQVRMNMRWTSPCRRHASEDRNAMTTPLKVSLKAVLVFGAWMSWVGTCFAQQPTTIRVLLLNGNNGAPLADASLIFDSQCKQGTLPECVRIYSGAWPWQKANAAGVIDLPVSEILVSFTISRHTSDFKYCQKVGEGSDEAISLPRFTVADIIHSGVVATNTCNSHLNIQPKPGQLVFFLRPLTVFEQLTKPPQM
jgi:hypothetical protein